MGAPFQLATEGRPARLAETPAAALSEQHHRVGGGGLNRGVVASIARSDACGCLHYICLSVSLCVCVFLSGHFFEIGLGNQKRAMEQHKSDPPILTSNAGHWQRKESV